MTDLNFKTKLSLPLVVVIVVGMMIGGGIFVYTGLVYEQTGPLLPLAFGLAGIPVLISMIPLAMLGAAKPVTGANYMYPSRMVSVPLAFAAVWVYALASFFGQIPLYVLATGKYLNSLSSDIPIIPIALVILTVFYLLNLRGIKMVAQFQGLLLLLLIAALLLFCFGGIEELNSDFLSLKTRNGSANLLFGTALLTFTYFGANGIIELGSEIKNPGKTIPRSFYLAFPIVMILYVGVAFVLVGTTDPNRITSEEDPLIFASRVNLSAFGFRFFVLGGAVLALITTLNALFLIGTRSLLMIVHDRILPQWLGQRNAKGVPWVLLTVIWILSIFGTLSGFSLEDFASYAALGGLFIFLPVLFAALKFPAQYPHAYQNSAFKLPRWLLRFCVGIGILMVLFFGLAILVDMGSLLKSCLFAVFIGSGYLYFYLRTRYLRKSGKTLKIEEL